MSKSKIEWTEKTWNPVTGCTKISIGCENCYAERMALRLQAMGQSNYVDGFAVRCHEHMLNRPLAWKRPAQVFVNSMSDLFHEEVSDQFLARVFDVMKQARRHQFQVLTKRAARLESVATQLSWTENIWMGVTVEHSDYAGRIDALRNTPAHTRFLSLEPLLGAMPNLDLKGIDWVIVGGESGPGARPMEKAWVVQIQEQCTQQGVPFFFKQWGGVNKKKNGRTLKGQTWDQMPGPAVAR
jgi:protein gp37